MGRSKAPAESAAGEPRLLALNLLPTDQLRLGLIQQFLNEDLSWVGIVNETAAVRWALAYAANEIRKMHEEEANEEAKP